MKNRRLQSESHFVPKDPDIRPITEISQGEKNNSALRLDLRRGRRPLQIQTIVRMLGVQ